MRRALLLVPALLLAACGGGGTDAKAEFVAAADEVCAEAKADFDAGTQPTELDKLADYVDGVVRVLEQAEADLSALTPPEDDKAEIQAKLLGPLEADVKVAQDFAAKVRAAGGNGVKLLPLLSQRPKTTVDVAFARSYGLGTCAEAAEAAQ
jgi:hypothetical protein